MRNQRSGRETGKCFRYKINGVKAALGAILVQRLQKGAGLDAAPLPEFRPLRKTAQGAPKTGMLELDEAGAHAQDQALSGTGACLAGATFHQGA
jgi:hypothetical protein